MKRKKLTGITLMLATAVVSTAVGGVLLSKNSVSADETSATTDKTYALSSVFSVKNAEIGASEEKVAKFTLSDAGSVTYKNDLALNWYAKNENTVEEQFFNVKFAFADTNFKAVTLSMDTTSAWATKDDLSTNTITFFKTESGALGVYFNDATEAATTIAKADATKAISLRFADGAADGEFKVEYAIADGAYSELGVFENIGANYAQYSNTTDNESFPLTFEANIDTANAKTSVLLYELNGQKFDGVTTSDDTVTVKDTAAPVVVVNEELGGFLLGTAITLDYKVIDVLNAKNLAIPVVAFYQWTPAKTDAPVFDETEDYKNSDYKKLTTSSTYLMDTVYYEKDGAVVTADTEGAVATSVFAKEGNEYISILVKTSDGQYKDVVYDLAWYANAAAKVTKGDRDYIVVNKNEEGPKYSAYVNQDEEFDADAYENDTVWNDFQTALAKAAEDVVAGSNSSIRFPSFKWLLNDNNGYRNLKFTISYKTPNSTSASTSSSLSYNALKLSVSTAGTYEFKIFAVDKAGNAMQCREWDDEKGTAGEVVDVSSSNIWDLKQIPSFTFTIKNGTLKVDEPKKTTDKKDTVSLDTTYTLSDLEVVGAKSLKEDYALFKVNLDKYNVAAENGKLLSQSALTAITYEDLAKQITENDIMATDDYFELYITAYCKILANQVGTTADKIRPCFTLIDEYDSRITEDNDADKWNAYNKYSWSATSQSFKTAEEGTYLILADYYEEEIYTQRATAYQLVVVESKADVIEGESDWLANNKVSVILFAIAGVMLILIIILLLVKPSDETLEEIDEKATKKSEKKAKKDKKEELEEKEEE